MPRIAYFSFPVNDRMTGGRKAVFLHVQALREAGFDAYVFSRSSESPEWFGSDVTIAPIEEVRRDDDIIVIPEDADWVLERFKDWGNRKLLFCQNPYYIWYGLKGRGSLSHYGVGRILGTSRNIAAFCARRFPDIPLSTVPYPVDPSIYYPAEPKQLRIVYVPRKRRVESGFIRDFFTAKYPEFRHVPWRRIENQPEAIYAAALRESAVNLALGRLESFSLVTAEALASGCIVAGFTGYGADEYATTRNGFWAPEGDCLACVDLLADAVALASAGGADYREMRDEAVATAARYSPEAFKQRLVEFWRTEV